MKVDNWCENCRWWGGEREHDEDYPYGTCRVNPPTVQGNMRLPVKGDNWDKEIVVPKGAWPWTAFDDWCREFDRDPPSNTTKAEEPSNANDSR